MFTKTALILFAATLLSPIAVPPLHADDDHHNRYYDRDRHDYHEWNEAENRAWHRYWEEQHRPIVEWERAREAQRRAYWRWRHEHPDSLLWRERR